MFLRDNGMKKRSMFVALTALLLIQAALAGSAAALTIGGAVKQPLTLKTDDLLKMEAVSVRASELTGEKEYQGTFVYRGVPLKSLLEFAGIEKEVSSVFKKPTDLAIVARDKNGKTAVLSWGEVFYRNAQDVLIAVSAKGVMPHHQNCGECHDDRFYKKALSLLTRKMDFPKLVVTNDFYTDRNLEDLVSIEVVDLKGQSPKKEMKKLFSPRVVAKNGNEKGVEITDLKGYRRMEVLQKEVGDGRGYHGLKRFGGVSLKDILTKLKASGNPNALILVGAPDGYRASFSYGEVFLRPEGERILLADTLNGERLDEDGLFLLIPPDDLAADRDVKAVETIQVVTIPAKPTK